MADDLEQATLPRIPRKLQKKFSTTNQKVEEVKTETKEVRSDLAEAKKDIIAEIQNAQKATKTPKAKKASKPKAVKKKAASTSIKASRVVVIQAPKIKAKNKKTKVSQTAVKSVKPSSKSLTVTKTVTKTVLPVKSTKPSKKGKKKIVAKPKVKLVNERQFKSLKNQTIAIEQSVKKLRVELQKNKSDKQIEKLSKTILQVRKDSNRKLDALKKDVKIAKDASYQVGGLSEQVASMKSVISEVKDSQDQFLTEIRSRFESVENKPQTVVVSPATESITSTAVSAMKEDNKTAVESIDKVEKRLDELTARLRQEATAAPKTSDVTLHVPSVQKMVHARVPEEHIAAKLVELYFEQVASPNLKRQVDLDGLVNAYVYALDKLHQKKISGEKFPTDEMIEKEVEATISTKA